MVDAHVDTLGEKCTSVILTHECNTSDDAFESVVVEGYAKSQLSQESKGWKIRRVVIPPLLSLLSIPMIVTLSMRNQSRNKAVTSFGCDARDQVWIDGVQSKDKATIWDVWHPLDINLSFGRLLLWEARAIDITWDLIVGRGCQTVAAILFYHGFRIVVADILVDEPLTPKEMIAIQYATTSVSSLKTYCEGWWQKRPGRSPWCFRRFILLVVSVLYVLTLPTWLSAMTAYQTLLEPWLVYDNQSIWFNDMTPCAYSITDGGLIPGLHHGYCVRPDTPLYDAVLDYTGTPSVLKCYPQGNDATAVKPTTQGLTVHYGHPIFRYREDCSHTSYFDWPRGNTTVLPNHVLELEAGSYSWFDPNTSKSKTFTGKYLVRHGLCQLRNNLYSWGFSFMLLFTFALTTFIFSMVWSIVAFKHHSRIKPCQVDMAFQDLHTALVLSMSATREFGGDIESALESGVPVRNLSRVRVTGDHVGARFLTRPKPELPPEASTTTYVMHSEGYETYLRKNNRPEFNLKAGISHPGTPVTTSSGDSAVTEPDDSTVLSYDMLRTHRPLRRKANPMRLARIVEPAGARYETT